VIVVFEKSFEFNVLTFRGAEETVAAQIVRTGE